jgi:hypothetical protein
VPLVKKKKKKKLSIFAGKFCIIVDLRFGETKEGEERLESEFFDKKGAEKFDSFIFFCFVSHGEKESVITVCMYGCVCAYL